MKNMERELVCPVCKEMYKQPLALPCTHNVCHVCASEVLLQHGHLYCDPTSEPTSPAATPSTRSPRLGRRAVPKPDRLDRLLKSGGARGAGRRDRGSKGTGVAEGMGAEMAGGDEDIWRGQRWLEERGMAGGDRKGWLEGMEVVGGDGDSRRDEEGWRGQGWVEWMSTEMAEGNRDGWRGWQREQQQQRG